MLFVTTRTMITRWFGQDRVDAFFVPGPDEDPEELVFGERIRAGRYRRLPPGFFLDQLRDRSYDHLILFIHGYSHLPEDITFQIAERLKHFFDRDGRGRVLILPMLWQSSARITNFRDYFRTRQLAAESGDVFRPFLTRLRTIVHPDTTKRKLHVIAHSMGNHLLGHLVNTGRKTAIHGDRPIFEHAFLVAPDVDPDALELPYGHMVPLQQVSRQVVVYHARHDIMLRLSRIRHLIGHNGHGRRLGRTGPKLDRVADNVISVDSSAGNFSAHRWLGHIYFVDQEFGARSLSLEQRRPTPALEHIIETVISGAAPARTDRTWVLPPPR